jgi:hypothetical protein
MVPVTVTV